MDSRKPSRQNKKKEDYNLYFGFSDSIIEKGSFDILKGLAVKPSRPILDAAQTRHPGSPGSPSRENVESPSIVCGGKNRSMKWNHDALTILDAMPRVEAILLSPFGRCFRGNEAFYFFAERHD